MHTVGLVNKTIEVIKNIAETICNSSPYNGRLFRVAVIPNNPTKAGNKPAKQPGQAPPKTPPNIPKIPRPSSPLEFIDFQSWNFIAVRLIVNAIKNGINRKLKNTKGIKNQILNEENKVSRVT